VLLSLSESKRFDDRWRRGLKGALYSGLITDLGVRAALGKFAILSVSTIDRLEFKVIETSLRWFWLTAR